MSSSIVASAPGKVVLLGEYAVLNGAPALVMAVGRRAIATVRTTDRGCFSLDAPDLALRGRRLFLDEDGPRWDPPLDPSAASALRVLNAVLEDIGRQVRDELPVCAIETDTREFMSPVGSKLGLGASAAVAVATWAALRSLADRHPPTPGTVLEAVSEIHRRAQDGVGSGVDVAAACLGGVLEYRLQRGEQGLAPTCRPTVLPERLRIVAIHTGTAASTPQLVGRVLALARRDAGEYRDLMECLAACARDGCTAVANGNVVGVLAAARTYGRLMAELGHASGTDIVSAAHRRVRTLVERAGAVYKPSGAGSGDRGLAFTADELVAARVRVAAAAEGLLAMDLAPDPRGVEVERSDPSSARVAEEASNSRPSAFDREKDSGEPTS